ncbi:hypothetical protein KGO95_02320 [Patescibacteria group bacterium]|nr:hypothetical protein [Patescibacteria group bacterium]
MRDNVIVLKLTSADTSFTDTGLTPHTTYSYKIRIPYPSESGYATSDTAPVSEYTKCLPQCGFGSASSSVVTHGSTTLQWTCLYNDPVVDTGSCKLTDSQGNTQTVNATNGSVTITPTATTTYTLSCTNVDGTISIPQTVSLFTPSIQEVKPQ